jgi:hypothetical protein
MSATLVPLAVTAPGPEKLTPPIERPRIERSVAITDKRSLDGDRCSGSKSTVALMYASNKELEREVKELRKANEILKLASAFFAQAELDRRLKS